MAETIAEAADRDAPVDTGRLKASQRIRENADGSYSVTYGDSKVQYAAVVHNSTRGRLNSGQRGWLRKAAMQGRKIGNAAAEGGLETRRSRDDRRPRVGLAGRRGRLRGRSGSTTGITVQHTDRPGAASVEQVEDQQDASPTTNVHSLTVAQAEIRTELRLMRETVGDIDRNVDTLLSMRERAR